ncbi:sensor histidine kinase [Gemmobacter lanyuensis]
MPISGQDEIGGLEQALNILRARAIEAADLRNRLEAAVLDRTADVVAEMQSANAARADAEAQSRAKTHFLARMSHEIRTPLNGLIGLLDLLAGDERDAKRRARLEVALTSARDLQAMTEDILAFSVTEDGQDQAERDPFDPVALARGLGAHLEVLAANKGLRAEVEIDPALPPALLGAAPKIRQVMMNLLSNAVKYTAQGGVTLSVTAHPAPDGQHEIAFAVRDTGPGMTAEETRHAFDIYGRSRSARQNGVVGVGLGLAIVRQLTDAMGARCMFRPGRGRAVASRLSCDWLKPLWPRFRCHSRCCSRAAASACWWWMTILSTVWWRGGIWNGWAAASPKLKPGRPRLMLPGRADLTRC